MWEVLGEGHSRAPFLQLGLKGPSVGSRQVEPLLPPCSVVQESWSRLGGPCPEPHPGAPWRGVGGRLSPIFQSIRGQHRERGWPAWSHTASEGQGRCEPSADDHRAQPAGVRRAHTHPCTHTRAHMHTRKRGQAAAPRRPLLLRAVPPLRLEGPVGGCLPSDGPALGADPQLRASRRGQVLGCLLRGGREGDLMPLWGRGAARQVPWAGASSRGSPRPSPRPLPTAREVHQPAAGERHEPGAQEGRGRAGAGALLRGREPQTGEGGPEAGAR